MSTTPAVEAPWSVFVPGEPKTTQTGSIRRGPQGRAWPVRRHTEWCNRIALAAQAAKPAALLEGALTARLVFYRTRPKAARHGRWPTTRPDLGNLSKGLLDALEGIIYADDAKIVDLAEAKRYADESPTGQPGVRIFVSRAH